MIKVLDRVLQATGLDAQALETLCITLLLAMLISVPIVHRMPRVLDMDYDWVFGYLADMVLVTVLVLLYAFVLLSCILYMLYLSQ